MNAYIYASAVGFLALNSFNVDNEFFPVDLDYFAHLLAFVVTAYYL